jgi:hypothetical protein
MHSASPAGADVCVNTVSGAWGGSISDSQGTTGWSAEFDFSSTTAADTATGNFSTLVSGPLTATVDCAGNDMQVVVTTSQGTLTLTSPLNSAAQTVNGTWTFSGGLSGTWQGGLLPPTVTSVSPNHGPVTGGTSVTITGTNLAGASAVAFGPMASTSFTSNSPTQITAKAPALGASVVDVTVTGPGGTSTPNSGDQYAFGSPGGPLQTIDVGDNAGQSVYTMADYQGVLGVGQQDHDVALVDLVGLATDPAGTIYTVDPGRGLIGRYAADGAALSAFMTGCPNADAADVNSVIYVSEGSCNGHGPQILAYDTDGNVLHAVLNGDSAGSSAMTADNSGNVFFLDGNGDVEEVPAGADPNAAPVQVVSGLETTIDGVAVGRDGTLYISDGNGGSGTQQVYVYKQTAPLTYTAQSPLTAPNFGSIADVVVDVSGNVFALDLCATTNGGCQEGVWDFRAGATTPTFTQSPSQSFGGMAITPATAPVGPAINVAATATAQVGVPFSLGGNTSGFASTPTIVGSGLPIGTTFTNNGDGTFTIAGTPTVEGIKVVKFTAKSGTTTVQATTTITVTAPPKLTGPAKVKVLIGAPLTVTMKTKAVPTASLGESGALPDGMTFTDNGDGTATIAGTPNAGSAGIYTLTITASNGVSPDATHTLAITVLQLPQITSGASTSATVGSPIHFKVTTTGFPAPSLAKLGLLPRGVTFVNNHDGTATIKGTPAAGTAGTYPITITAKNTAGSVTQTFTLTVS